MDKGLAKINSGHGDFDIMFGMNVWAVGRSIAAGLLRPYNHDYLPNFTNNVWDLFQSPFYDVGIQLHASRTACGAPASSGGTTRSRHRPGDMANPYDVFFDSPPKGKTALLANAQDVLAMPMFHDGLTDVNVTDPAVITKAKDDVAAIAQKAGGLSYDHVDYTDLPAGHDVAPPVVVRATRATPSCSSRTRATRTTCPTTGPAPTGIRPTSTTTRRCC